MAFPNNVVEFHMDRLDFSSPYAISDLIDASHVIYLRSSRCITFFLVIDFPCPLAYFPFVVVPLLLLGVFLPTTDGAAPLAPAAWYYGIPAIAIVYGPILLTSGFTSRALLRFRVSGPMLTLQPKNRFSLASALVGGACHQEPLAVGLRSSFVASGFIPLDHYFLHFFLGTPAPTVQRH